MFICIWDHSWRYEKDDTRVCKKCGATQKYSPEMTTRHAAPGPVKHKAEWYDVPPKK